MSNYGWALLSFKGRMNRSDFWIKGILMFLLPLYIFAYAVASKRGITAAYISLVIGAWPSYALNIKRLHDLDQSGSLLFKCFIPFTGLFYSIWICVNVPFIRGTVGPNRYGEDPA